ncbi:MAG: response regulator [Deltaproteobacteria bacterium]|nr:response regulator [Deltaproteobacteria bacterium]
MGELSDTTVLVADDEVKFRALVATYLRALGCRVLEAGDGDEAWELAQRERPDLAIIDAMMPGMSGWEVCRRIKAAGGPDAGAAPKVLMLTGIGQHLDDMMSPLFAADDWIDKPFQLKDLGVKIASLVGARVPEPALAPQAEPCQCQPAVAAAEEKPVRAAAPAEVCSCCAEPAGAAVRQSPTPAVVAAAEPPPPAAIARRPEPEAVAEAVARPVVRPAPKKKAAAKAKKAAPNRRRRRQPRRRRQRRRRRSRRESVWQGSRRPRSARPAWPARPARHRSGGLGRALPPGAVAWPDGGRGERPGRRTRRDVSWGGWNFVARRASNSRVSKMANVHAPCQTARQAAVSASAPAAPGRSVLLYVRTRREDVSRDHGRLGEP